MKTLLLALLRAYQFLLSPWIGGSCRYWPTCSEYAREAIETHGAARGGYMTVARLARCHPYGAGGVDPVPAQFRWRCWCGEQAPEQAAASRQQWHRSQGLSLPGRPEGEPLEGGEKVVQ